MLKDFFNKLKYKFSNKKLDSDWFIKRLPKSITTKKEADSLMTILETLNSEFTTEQFILYTKYESREKRLKLSEQMKNLIDSYLQYNLDITFKMDNFLQTMPMYKLTEDTVDKLAEFGEKNLEHVKNTVETYRNLITHISYY